MSHVTTTLSNDMPNSLWLLIACSCHLCPLPHNMPPTHATGEVIPQLTPMTDINLPAERKPPQHWVKQASGPRDRQHDGWSTSLSNFEM